MISKNVDFSPEFAQHLGLEKLVTAEMLPWMGCHNRTRLLQHLDAKFAELKNQKLKSVLSDEMTFGDKMGLFCQLSNSCSEQNNSPLPILPGLRTGSDFSRGQRMLISKRFLASSANAGWVPAKVWHVLDGERLELKLSGAWRTGPTAVISLRNPLVVAEESFDVYRKHMRTKSGFCDLWDQNVTNLMNWFCASEQTGSEVVKLRQISVNLVLNDYHDVGVTLH